MILNTKESATEDIEVLRLAVEVATQKVASLSNQGEVENALAPIMVCVITMSKY